MVAQLWDAGDVSNLQLLLVRLCQQGELERQAGGGRRDLSLLADPPSSTQVCFAPASAAVVLPPGRQMNPVCSFPTPAELASLYPLRDIPEPARELPFLRV